MTPKKDLTVLKAKEIVMAAQAVGRRKRLATFLAEDSEFRRIQRGPCQDPSVMATQIGEAMPQRFPTREISGGIPLADILDRRCWVSSRVARWHLCEIGSGRPFFLGTSKGTKRSPP